MEGVIFWGVNIRIAKKNAVHGRLKLFAKSDGIKKKELCNLKMKQTISFWVE